LSIKITVEKIKKKSYELPVIVEENDNYYMLANMLAEGKIYKIGLKSGNIYSNTLPFNSVGDYLEKFPSSRVVESEIIIK